MVLLFAGFGLYVYYCGICSGCCILYKFRHKMPVAQDETNQRDCGGAIVLEGQLYDTGGSSDPKKDKKQNQGDEVFD